MIILFDVRNIGVNLFLTLSDIQKKRFLDISGQNYIEGKVQDTFPTNRAYNDKKWEKHSPWIFSYVIEPETGNFICELSHRMTNNHINGWDREGNELSSDITKKYFTPRGLAVDLRIL